MLAGYVETILSGLAGAVSLLTDVASFPGVNTNAILLFFAGFDEFLAQFAAYSAAWATRGH